jgi:DNA (cytosine-5)-methyltransferase 1
VDVGQRFGPVPTLHPTQGQHVNRRPRLLDLFCCEGGAAMGYHRAGFDVVGVDTVDQPRYPFPFVKADALDYLAKHGSEFDAIHASPPCQAHTSLKVLSDRTHVDLVDVTRAALTTLGRPWIMENVPGAPMPAAVVLCGSMFGLGAPCEDGRWRQLRRHRLFEHHPALPLWPPYSCEHIGQPIGVYGHGGGGVMNRGRLSTTYKGNRAESMAAIGAPWMSRHGVSQAIPPAYTEHLGAALLQHLGVMPNA